MPLLGVAFAITHVEMDDFPRLGERNSSVLMRSQRVIGRLDFDSGAFTATDEVRHRFQAQGALTVVCNFGR